MIDRRYRRTRRRDRRGPPQVIRLPAGPVAARSTARRDWALRAAAILSVTLAVASCGLF